MTRGAWDGDLFRCELTSTLVETLEGAPDVAGLERAVAVSSQAAEDLCRDRPMACGKGCPHCCVLNVSILLPEGMLIADWLRSQLADEEYSGMREHLAAHRRRVRWMDDEERIFAGVKCPFLDDVGSCSIHQVRPLVCRGAASLDSNRCREAFKAFDPYAERFVPADLLRQAAYDEAFKALAEALRLHDLDDRSIELGGGVLAFLDHPESLDALLSGERLPRDLWE